MNTLLIANGISFISACFTVAASWTQSPGKSYRFQVGQCLAYAAASYFFGVYASIPLMLINAFRNFLVAEEKYSFPWMALCSAVSLAAGLAVNGGSGPGCLSIFMTVFYTVSSFYLKGKRAVKINVIIDLSMWFIYDLLVIDVPSGIVDLVSVIVALISLRRICASERKPAEK